MPGRTPPEEAACWPAGASRLAVALSTSRDGQTYIQRLTGDEIDTYLERDAANDFVDYGDYGWGKVERSCSK